MKAWSTNGTIERLRIADKLIELGEGIVVERVREAIDNMLMFVVMLPPLLTGTDTRGSLHDSETCSRSCNLKITLQQRGIVIASRYCAGDLIYWRTPPLPKYVLP